MQTFQDWHERNYPSQVFESLSTPSHIRRLARWIEEQWLPADQTPDDCWKCDLLADITMIVGAEANSVGTIKKRLGKMEMDEAHLHIARAFYHILSKL